MCPQNNSVMAWGNKMWLKHDASLKKKPDYVIISWQLFYGLLGIIM